MLAGIEGLVIQLRLGDKTANDVYEVEGTLPFSTRVELGLERELFEPRLCFEYQFRPFHSVYHIQFITSN